MYSYVEGSLDLVLLSGIHRQAILAYPPCYSDENDSRDLDYRLGIDPDSIYDLAMNMSVVDCD